MNGLIRIRKLLTVIFLLSFQMHPGKCHAQTPDTVLSNKAVVMFRFNSSVLDTTYRNNYQSLNILNRILRNPSGSSILDSVVVKASTSPDGNPEYNMQLSARRANTIKSYLIRRYAISSDKIILHPLGANWQGLQDLIHQDLNMPYRQQVMEILKNTNNQESREQELKLINNGKVWGYIVLNHFHQLRIGAVCMISYHISTAKPETTVIQSNPPDSTRHIHLVEKHPVADTPIHTPTEAPSTQSVIKIENTRNKPLFALKTNLLYYALGVLNLGAEFYATNKISVDLPITYSPYTLGQCYKFRTFSIQPEGRYWLDLAGTGHFAGIHAHWGYYNVAWNQASRYQDKNGNSPLWGFGLTYGYALPLKNRWAVEFLIGAGYANLQYDEFYNIPNGALFSSYTRNYWGITRAGINLVYKFTKSR